MGRCTCQQQKMPPPQMTPTITSDNIVLRTLGRFIRGRAAAVGSVYGVDALAVSRAGVGSAVWCSFAGLVRGVLGL